MKRLVCMVGLLVLMALALVDLSAAGGRPVCREAACAAVAPACPEGGPWLLVYRYTVNVQEAPFGLPVYETREQFDGQRFPTEEAAYCGAARVRQTGVLLPTLERFGRDSNVMPETITPMPHLLAVRLGIHGPGR